MVTNMHLIHGSPSWSPHYYSATYKMKCMFCSTKGDKLILADLPKQNMILVDLPKQNMILVV